MDRAAHWHILVIDDNPDDRADFRQMLISGSGRTCHFAEAELGSTGLQMILDNQAQSLSGNAVPFDCVLLDFNLPDQNAKQVLTTLCGTSDSPPCPVVVITGWDGVQADEGMNLLRAGAQDYIGKGWTTEPSLCRAVENSIDRYQLQRTHNLANLALAKSEERYRTLFNSIDEGYCIVEMIFDAQDRPVDYRFLEVSQSFERQTGLTGATGKTILQLIPQLEEHWLQAYGRVAQTGEPVRLLDHVEHMNRWFDLYAFRFGDPVNRQLGILFNNVTEQKIIEAQLHEALAQAQTANRAKSEFLSNMSHELRTPLNSILGFAQLMQSSIPPPMKAQAQCLSEIVKAGWYLLDLVNDTLDLAAIEAGKLSVYLTAVSLDDVLQDCAAIIGPLAAQRNLSVSYPPADLVHIAYADPTRVKQVLLNLLSNSVKYNRHGGSISVRCNMVDGKSLRISVQDTGLGMTPDQLEHLFEVFNRLGQEHSGVVGTGIGLVMCKRLVELMEGRLGFDSVSGKGSNFWIDLPLAPSLMCAAAPIEAERSRTPLSDQPVGHTVLHIDDNPGNLELVAQLLAQRPEHRLLSASLGALGLEIARAHLPAVILMDIDLPDISGTEVLQMLQSDKGTSHIPAIALTANALTQDIQKGLQAGFFRYVTKPIRVQEFFESLDAALLFAQHNASNSRNQSLEIKDTT
jgi:signal transduction histidine kinase